MTQKDLNELVVSCFVECLDDGCTVKIAKGVIPVNGKIDYFKNFKILYRTRYLCEGYYTGYIVSLNFPKNLSNDSIASHILNINESFKKLTNYIGDGAELTGNKKNAIYESDFRNNYNNTLVLQIRCRNLEFEFIHVKSKLKKSKLIKNK